MKNYTKESLRNRFLFKFMGFTVVMLLLVPVAIQAAARQQPGTIFKEMQKALDCLAKEQSTTKLEQFIAKRGINAGDCQDYGNPLRSRNGILYHALAHPASKQAVDFLLKQPGIIVDKADSEQHTPLRVAVWLNDAEVVKALIQAGANPELRDKYGDTVLLQVLRLGARDPYVDELTRFTGNIDGIKQLIASGASVQACNESTKASALGHLLRAFRPENLSGTLDIMKLLLMRGADLYETYKDPEARATISIDQTAAQIKDVGSRMAIQEVIAQERIRRREVTQQEEENAAVAQVASVRRRLHRARQTPVLGVLRESGLSMEVAPEYQFKKPVQSRRERMRASKKPNE